jgi:NADH pyrophosphatase NudC (nudix superfamily)
MTAKAGLMKHGKVAEEALLREFMQERDLDVYKILDP